VHLVSVQEDLARVGAALLAWLHDRSALTTDLALGAADLESALEFACQVASLTCTRAGAEPPRRAALIR
jgi:fructokinase